MSDIDETTGLPELPEGQFWRVTGGTEYSHYTSPSDSITRVATGNAVIQIVNKVKMIVYPPRFILGIQFGLKKPVESYEDFVLCTQHLWNPENKVATTDAKSNDHVKIGRRPNGQFGGTYSLVKMHEITPELVLLAAEECLRNYKKSEKAKTLVGDYPPNNISLPNSSAD